MPELRIILPHQLFALDLLPDLPQHVLLLEEPLLFTQFRFHTQKIALHRASMKAYERTLYSSGRQVHYIDARDPRSESAALATWCRNEGYESLTLIDPDDDWILRRLRRAASDAGLSLHILPSPLFLNTPAELKAWFSTRKTFFQTDFYIHQRKQRGILLTPEGKPLGGKWSFDAENRERNPRGKTPPAVQFPDPDEHVSEALVYTREHFSDHYGGAPRHLLYPHTHALALDWLRDFLRNRFAGFGPYEDAIVHSESILHHSVLTPMLNIGLLTPQQILDETLSFAEAHEVPINSLEGFIRQIIGWREFIRAVYRLRGVESRTRNYWGFTRPVPESFWNATTGIAPIDITIRKVLKTGYAHHIERLMVLGNFMLLCEFDPDSVYQWFMELFIDSYDWVMVPNVYGMSQFADGGIFSTKPYISGSNYLMKMSDYPKGDWQATWDGLFWRFMHEHRDFFGQNPRLGMLLKTLDNMDNTKREAHFRSAETWLSSLDR
jgi:deoxyribodipyrimidine photolyase-related protein